ncbi:MAG: hypothetical protein ACX930_10160 [Erythrobacter sp.]
MSGPFPLSARSAIAAGVLLASPSFAQERDVSGDGSNVAPSPTVFVDQAPEYEDNSSKVYLPDAITPQSVAEARARAAEQQQLEQAEGADREVVQLSRRGEGARDVVQLSDGDSARALAQLTNEERQVLLEAVEGTDICDRADNIPAIRALCKNRIESRSAEFAPRSTGGSAEDNLLGGRFDSTRLATLEAAIARLARSAVRPDDLSDQAIASVALGQQTGLSNAEESAGEGDPAAELSPETQALVNAIVTHLGGN